MKKKILLKVWIVLIVLTVSVALVANLTLSISFTAIIILSLSILKFLGVSFYFMELKKAHVFWKAAVLMYVFLFFVIIIILL
ncbi:cytochrome c oxidase subunit IV [Lutibacter oceani]|uniref:Cytochrome c oxidase subunit IV n=1 Tax=Lutibacter oceani TaxID=1853311 RepID=A0A3D9RKH1_9FLAO|nr:cytochrome C oxidase subunit IV family protein [Lutibacter oceani]REE80373.1 cytochrome c oxidase subunit IV [Lutibacter oceani]